MCNAPGPTIHPASPPTHTHLTFTTHQTHFKAFPIPLSTPPTTPPNPNPYRNPNPNPNHIATKPKPQTQPHSSTPTPSPTLPQPHPKSYTSHPFPPCVDRPTDRGGLARSGAKSYVDSLLTFSETLAYDYSGEWLQTSALEFDQTFVITILQVRASSSK